MKSKVIIMVSVLAVVAIIAYFIIRRRKAAAQELQPAATSKSPTLQPQSIVDNDHVYPWEIGTRGTNVQGIQYGLNQAYNAGLSEDGIFGEKTATALLKNMGVRTIFSYDNRIQLINVMKQKIKAKIWSHV